MKNLFYELTVKSLKNNKIRTTATLIGVVVSVALITNIIFTASSLHNFMIDDIKYRFGDWSVQIENNKGKVKEKTDALELEHGTMTGISYAYLDRGVNPDKPFMYIATMDEKMKEITHLEIKEGRLPEKADEILIPDHVLTNGGIRHEVGDEITLDEGYRVNIVNGEELTQREPYSPKEEVFIQHRMKTYKVVGISNRPAVEPYMAAGYTALTVPQEKIVHAEDSFFKSEDYDDIKNIVSKYYISPNAVMFNEPLLRAEGHIRGDSSVNDLIVLSILLVVFIGICGYLLMYNAFTFSLREHVKAYQTLASVGATSKQLRKASLYEGMFIATIGITLGMILGMILGSICSYVIINCFGSNIVSMFSMYSHAPLTYSVSKVWVITALAVSNLMVILSIILPAYRTGKIKPVENYEYDRITESDRRGLGKSNIFKKGTISLEGKLAIKNFRKNSKIYRYPIVSLTLSIVLFLSAGSIGAYMETILDMVESPDIKYDISYASKSYSESEKAFIHLSTVEGVEKCSNFKYYNCSMNIGNKNRNAIFYIIDDDTFEDYLDINNIDKSKYFNPDNPKAIALSYITEYDDKSGRFAKKEITDMEKIAGKEGTIPGIKEKIEISDYIEDLPENNTLEIGRFVVMMSKSSAKKINIDDSVAQFQGRAYFIVKDNSKTYSTMENVCKKNGLGVDYLLNIEKERENIKSTVMVIKFMSYAFIILISIIAVMNMFNSISSNIGMRQLEFASLLSIGMSKKSLDKMIYRECCLIGLKTLLYSVPLTQIVLYLIYKNSSLSNLIGYIFPWISTILSIVMVTIIVIAIMMYGTYKVHQKDMASVLKNWRY